jgi:hypothetical protein
MIFHLERHANGPRVYLLGRRVHEYHLGAWLLVAAAITGGVQAGPFWLETGLEAASGFWLIVKDWPDLFPATRDTASWRVGIHRPPSLPWDATVRSPLRFLQLLKRCDVAGQIR